jgi:hypothetical protein
MNPARSRQQAELSLLSALLLEQYRPVLCMNDYKELILYNDNSTIHSLF